MKFTIKNGASADLLSPAEHRAHITENTASWFQERARGVGTARFDGDTVVSGAALQIPSVASGEVIGPNKGFVWKVQRITAANLNSGDILNVYRNSVVPGNLIGYITASSSFPIGGKPPILRGGERLLITQGATLTATGDVIINGEADEVTESDIYKLIG